MLQYKKLVHKNPLIYFYNCLYFLILQQSYENGLYLKNIKAMREWELEIKETSKKLSKVLFQFFKYLFIFLSLKRFKYILFDKI